MVSIFNNYSDKTLDCITLFVCEKCPCVFKKLIIQGTSSRLRMSDWVRKKRCLDINIYFKVTISTIERVESTISTDIQTTDNKC